MYRLCVENQKFSHGFTVPKTLQNARIHKADAFASAGGAV
jgi:hypothetical protein